jgi:hypothetical protein
MNILKGRGRYSRSTYIRINRPLPLVQTTQQNHASRTTRLANACAFKTHAIEFKAMTTPHLSLSPFLARTVTALALFRTIAPHFALLRDAFETLEDGLDSILKRSLRALSATRTHSEEDEDEEEEEMRLVKHSADSIAALRAMEYRRGRKALVKDKFAKKLAGTKYATNAC